MILSANQPYFLPYFPYWQLIHAADHFLVGDDYAYIKRGWINRNYILCGGRPIWFRLPVQKMSSYRLISETTLVPIQREEMLQTLEMAYHKAPFFQEGYALADRILSCPETNLALFLTASIREVCAYLGIETTIGFTSHLEGNSLLKREERIYDFCKRLGAEQYINASGAGRELYHFDEFRKRGIRLSFIRSQAGEAGTLSVMDAIMKHSRDALHTMLDQYTLIDG